MRVNGETMWQMAEFNHKTRRRCQGDLNVSLAEIDSKKNQIFGME